MRTRGLVLLGLALLLLARPVSAADAPQTFALHPEPKAVPEIQFQDSDGKTLTLADFRGKVVLLNIWATWCVPCRREMPTLDRLQAELGGPDFQVLPLSIDRNGLEAITRFYAEVGVKHLGMYLDSSTEAAATLGAVGLPTTLLIDRDGREIGRLVGPAEWDSPDMVAFLRGYLGTQNGFRERELEPASIAMVNDR
jgi:thiol-disulfide isomerase/thioredoxin